MWPVKISREDVCYFQVEDLKAGACFVIFSFPSFWNEASAAWKQSHQLIYKGHKDEQEADLW